MRILQQSAFLSYSPFLALPAPKIVGLLPARVGVEPRVSPPPKPFVYADPCLAGLSDKTRAEFDKLLTTLLDATVGLLVDDRSEAEFALANDTFARLVKALYHETIIGDPKPVIASPFAEARRRLDEKLEQIQAESKIRRGEAQECIAREIAARHIAEGRP